MEGGDGMHCLICQNVVDHEVLSFWGEVICQDCEAELMELAVDQPGYDHIVRVFRHLWQRQLLAARDRHLMEGDHL